VERKEEKAMPLVIGEKELEQAPVSVDPEIVSGAPVFHCIYGKARGTDPYTQLRTLYIDLQYALYKRHTKVGLGWNQKWRIAQTG
jgi:hypothetical protein